MTAAVLVVLGSLAGMELVSYVVHRFVMHGPGWPVHADHHRRSSGGWERNDLYPASFAIVAVVLFALGTSRPQLRLMVAAGTGMTLYGIAYAYVHELCIHRRLPFDAPAGRYGRWLRRMHRIHHLYGGEPYGMLLPIVPRALRRRAAFDDRDPLARAVSTRDSRSRL